MPTRRADGRYKPLARWEPTAAGSLVGSLEMPLAVGIVGGATRTHPTAQAWLRMLGVTTAESAGARSSSPSAWRRTSRRCAPSPPKGIQKGHMALHAQTMAMQAGATGDEIASVARAMIARGQVRQDVAEEELARLRGGYGSASA